MVFAAFELHVDVLMAMRLNGSEVEALLPPANATNVSAAGALVISAVLFRRGPAAGSQRAARHPTLGMCLYLTSKDLQ